MKTENITACYKFITKKKGLVANFIVFALTAFEGRSFVQCSCINKRKITKKKFTCSTYNIKCKFNKNYIVEFSYHVDFFHIINCRYKHHWIRIYRLNRHAFNHKSNEKFTLDNDTISIKCST